MKLTINSIELTKALEQAAKFVSAKPLMPILGNLQLLATDENKLYMTGFNLAHGIEIECAADVIDRGSVCIPSLAIAIVKGMSGQLIIETNETDLITISNLSGKVEIQGQSTEEYPELISEDFDPKLRQSIDAKSFAQAVKYCTQATSTDESKQVLTGVNIASDSGKLRLMATDGHRLVVCNIAVDEGVNIESVTIPAKSLSLVPIDKSETISIAVDNSQVSIESGSTSIMRTLEGKYPNAMLLIPKSFSRELTIDRRELIDALNMMSAISDQNNLVKFSINSHAEISSSSDGKSGKVNISCQLNGDAIDLAFNLKYLLDGLKMFESKDIKFSMNGELTPVIITDVDSDVDLMYLIMPIQLRT
jgi:DNA polymerase III subunit beta